MNGFLILDKPAEITSFSAVRHVRRCLSEKKVGHSGTLDPMATGVLTVAVGRATAFLELLPDHDKSYESVFRLGLTTDTLDITGTILSRSDDIPDEAAVRSALDAFRGEITQLPPMYSAVKVNGQRLYELARQGREAARQPRQATVCALDCERLSEREYALRLSCSSGTYVRSIIDDLGRALGCGAVMTYLRRTRANGFALSDAVRLDELSPDTPLLPVERAMETYPAVYVTEKQAVRFSNGGSLDRERLRFAGEDGLVRVYGPKNAFLGVGTMGGDALTVKKLYLV